MPQYIKHIVSESAPADASIGDEWYNPITNKFYKRIVVSGKQVQWSETPTASALSAGQSTTTSLVISPSGVITVSATVPGLTNFVDTLSVATPNATIPAASLKATNAGYSNIDAVFGPKGTGSILASVPDNTATGGNKRGSNSVDLQTSRSSASQVATGNYSVLLGGTGNTISITGNAAFLGAGSGNTITGVGGWSYQTLVGGQNNTITYSNNAFLGGGYSNRISAGSYMFNYGVLAGGTNNTVDSDKSAIVGGELNTTLGYSSFIGGGRSNTIRSYWGSIGGGRLNSSTNFISLTFASQSGKTAVALSADNSAIKAGMVYANVFNNGNLGTDGDVYVTSYTAAGSTFATSSGSGNGVSYTLLHAGGTYAVDSWVTIAGTTLTSGSINGTWIVTSSTIGSVTFAAAATGSISVQGTIKQSTTIVLSAAASQTYNTSGALGGTCVIFYPGVTIGGGVNNQANGMYTTVVGGGDYTSASNGNNAGNDWAFVGGGKTNKALARYSTIVGGYNNIIQDSASDPLNPSVYSFIGGGYSNTIAGPSFQGGYGGNTIVGGNNNTINGNYSGHVIVGGTSNTAGNGPSNTFYNFIGAGTSNQTGGNSSVVTGGANNISLADYSTIVGGRYGTTRSIIGMSAIAACSAPIASASGVSQSSLLILARQTTDATPTVLTSDANAASTTNQIILPNNSAFYFKGSVIANVTGGGNTKAWTIEGAIKRGATASSTVLVGTPTVTSGYADAGASSFSIAVTADTTNGGITVTATGVAATTIRWVCKLETTEVTF